MATRYIYRDTKTGRFGKKSAWKRSKVSDGGKYRREKVVSKLREFFVSLEYHGKRPRILDFFVLAKERADVLQLVYDAIFEDGQDALGYDLEWAKRIPWQESDVDEIKPKDSQITVAKRFWNKERVEVH